MRMTTLLAAAAGSAAALAASACGGDKAVGPRAVPSQGAAPSAVSAATVPAPDAAGAASGARRSGPTAAIELHGVPLAAAEIDAEAWTGMRTPARAPGRGRAH